MPSDQQRLEVGIIALEAQRAVLGDDIVDSLLAAARAQLAALQSPSTVHDGAAQRLKQVTILFLDVVGSTTLSQHLDPEAIGDMMDGALARGTSIVTEHRGKVLQYAGDNLLAIFGADEAGEDDAERAVRCGLALLRLGKTLGAEVQAAYGLAGFDVRIGIHTGSVLLGGGVDGDGSIRGIAVNVAARMEQAAPAGALRISQDTYTQVRGVFDVEAQEPLAVKGVEVPVVSYLVQRLKARAFRVAARGIEGVATRMIGRDAELGLLQGAFKRLVMSGAGFQRVTVVAEAGIGKSRLLDEFRNWAEVRPERYIVFQARAVPQTQGRAYGLLRDVLAWRFEISDDDAMDVTKQKLEAGLMPLFVEDEGQAEAQAHAHLLGLLIGLDYDRSPHIRGIKDDGRQIRNRGFHAAAQFFRRIADQGGSPLVIYLDDLHWADDASLDFIEYLGQVNREVPMLLLALTRPTLFERRTTDTETMPGEQRIELHALDKGHSRDLVNELLKKLPEIPGALCDLVTGGADGNPFYMEERVRMLIDQRAIDTAGAAWSVNAAELHALKVPPSLTGVLQVRLDSLPQAERHALQLASVIGQNFWDAALAHVEADAAAELPRLLQRGLVHARDTGNRADGIREYAFQHQLLHQVTYDTVLKGTRRAAHAKAAQWLAEQSGARAGTLLGTAAEHYENADDLANAAEFYARATQNAADTYASEAVLDYAARALGVAAPEAHALRWRVHAACERTFDMLGRRAEQQQSVEALHAVAEALDNDERRAEAALRRGALALRTGNHETSGIEAGRAEMLARQAGNEELELLALRVRATSLSYRGSPALGRAIAEAAYARASALGLLSTQMLLCNTLSICAGEAADRDSPRRYDALHLSLARQNGNRHSEAVALSNIGLGLLHFGDYGAARLHLEDALRLSRTLGVRQLEGSISSALSALAHRRGDDAQALSLAQTAAAIAAETGARRYQISALENLGNAELALGRHQQAATAFEQSEALARGLGHALAALWALEGRMRVAIARDDPGTAADLAGQLLGTAAQDPLASFGEGADPALDPFNGDPLIRLSLHRVLSRCSDPRAGAVLAGAYRRLMIEADAIDDAALRHSYLTNVAENREIVALWAVQQGTGSPGG